MKKKINLIVEEQDKNLRVDVFINKKEKSISRTRIKNLILDKQLNLNDRIMMDPSKKINPAPNIAPTDEYTGGSRVRGRVYLFS